ncbi:hypothetical protein LTR28_011887, partial [Elasticomyces elasticus]
NSINGDHFTSAAAHLISLYIPSSVASAIDSAAAAASVTGPPGSIIQSALLATATPAWFTGVPSQYIPNINALESQITALRDAQQSTNNAQRVVTTTDNHGNTFIEVLSATHATQTVVVVPTSTTTPSVQTTTVSTTVTTTHSSTTSTTTTHASTSPPMTSSPKALAAATDVPVAVMGVIGALGVVMAL